MNISPTESSNDFRPYFFASSFDLSLTKLKRSPTYFNYLCEKKLDVNIKQVLNCIESYACHTHFGLFSTNGCILLSDLCLAFLKDEKTIKKYVENTIDFFNKNTIKISNKKTKNTCEQPIFNDLRLIKTDSGFAITYSFSHAASQLIKLDLTTDHFFEMYCRKHNIIDNNFQNFNKIKKFISSCFHVSSLIPSYIVNQIFEIEPANILNFSLYFNEKESSLISKALEIDYTETSLNQNDYVSMQSWIDIALSKSSESNLYYFCLDKFVKNLKNKFSKNKNMCNFEIRVSKVKKILKRTSDNYDNTSIKTYLSKVCVSLNENTDLNVAFKVKSKTKGDNLTFQFIVVKKADALISAARQKLLSEEKVKNHDNLYFSYQDKKSRNLTTNAFYSIENDKLKIVDNVLFDDLIKNPKKSQPKKALTSGDLSNSNAKTVGSANLTPKVESAALQCESDAKKTSSQVDFSVSEDSFNLKLDLGDQPIDQQHLKLNVALLDKHCKKIPFDKDLIHFEHKNHIQISRKLIDQNYIKKANCLFIELSYNNKIIHQKRINIVDLIRLSVQRVLSLKGHKTDKICDFGKSINQVKSNLDSIGKHELTFEKLDSVIFYVKQGFLLNNILEINKSLNKEVLSINLYDLVKIAQKIRSDDTQFFVKICSEHYSNTLNFRDFIKEVLY
jgi:hypothetical protein